MQKQNYLKQEEALKKNLHLHKQAQQEHKQKPLSDLHNSIPSL